jgi:hypothetical protein
MDTQKIVRKYLWYDLIANLCFGLVAMINNLDNFIKADTLKTVVSTVGLINIIIFVVFTVKSRRLMNKYYDSELNKMGISLPSVGDKNFQELLDKAQEKLKSCSVDGLADKLSEDYMRYNLIFTTITMLFVFFQMVISNMRFELLLAFTIVLECGFIFNMTLEYKFSQNIKEDNNDKEQKSPQTDK